MRFEPILDINEEEMIEIQPSMDHISVNIGTLTKIMVVRDSTNGVPTDYAIKNGGHEKFL